MNLTTDVGGPAVVPPDAVLDTNVVLDWLVFDDPAVRRLGAHIDAGALRWIGTADTCDELRTVLSRPGLERWAHRLQAAEVITLARCVIVPGPALADCAALRSTDPDDQKFMDCALLHRAAWLFSRDKALLRLARAAWRLHRVRVLRPIDWVG